MSTIGLGIGYRMLKRFFRSKEGMLKESELKNVLRIIHGSVVREKSTAPARSQAPTATTPAPPTAKAPTAKAPTTQTPAPHSAPPLTFSFVVDGDKKVVEGEGPSYTFRI
ncbi:hypothetical protein NEDG_01856 [Nematocida displodere]|uniref:Uncharacterized protein n=1 Tax=Nematocida displodere TaxID=1805483 RepID=A0A177EIX9_9MICR|nr:hypothetical protein NEDG_01856 [Nematocida displodere]